MIRVEYAAPTPNVKTVRTLHTETGLFAHTDVRLNKSQYVRMKIHTRKNIKALTSENEAKGGKVLLAGHI